MTAIDDFDLWPDPADGGGGVSRVDEALDGPVDYVTDGQGSIVFPAGITLAGDEGTVTLQPTETPAPAAPTVVTIVTDQHVYADISWTVDPDDYGADTVVGFEVLLLRTGDTVPQTLPAETGSPVQTPPLDGGAEYTVWLVAYDRIGIKSVASAPTVFTTPAEPPAFIADRSVDANHLAAEILLSSRIIAGEVDEANNLVGRWVEMGPAGLYFVDAAGNPIIELPNDSALPAVFRGDAEIDHLTVREFTTLQQSELAEGATFTMESSVTAPTNPPSVAFTYDSKQFTKDGKWGDRVGWATDGTNWFTARQVGAEFRVERWSAAGALAASSLFWVESTAHGCVYSAGALYVLASHGPGGADWLVQKFDPTTLAHVGEWRNWNEDDGTRSPALGVDPATGDLLIAQSRPTNGDKVRIRRYTYPASGSTLTAGSFVDTDFAYAVDLAGVAYGSFDYGANRFILTSRSSLAFRATDAAGVYAPDGNWPSGMQGKVGFLWDGTNFRSMDTSGLMRKYETGNTFVGADSTWYAAVTWRNVTNGTETDRGPVSTFTMQKRSRLKVTAAALPSGVTEARVYLRKGTAPGAAPSMTLQGSTTGTTAPSLTIPAATFAANNDPATNTFGAGTPAEFQSAASDALGPRIDFRGNGFARVGNHTDRLMFGASELFSKAGAGVTPLLAVVTASAYWEAVMLNATGNQSAGCQFIVPDSWVSFHVDIWWINEGGGAGNVTIRSVYMADGVANAGSLAITGGDLLTVAAPVSGVAKVTRLTPAVACTPGRLMVVHAERRGAEAADTLANNLGVLAVVITKAS